MREHSIQATAGAAVCTAACVPVWNWNMARQRLADAVTSALSWVFLMPSVSLSLAPTCPLSAIRHVAVLLAAGYGRVNNVAPQCCGSTIDVLGVVCNIHGFV